MPSGKPRIPDDRPTLVTCLACGGQWRIEYTMETGGYAVSTCAWCHEGGMTAAQVARWSARKQGRP